MADLNQEARIPVYINDEQAKSAIKNLTAEADKWRKKMFEAMSAGDLTAMKEAERELKIVNGQMNSIKKEAFDVNKILQNISNASLKDLRQALRAVDKEMEGLNRSSEEYQALMGKKTQLRAELNSINEVIKEQPSFFSRAADGFNEYLGVVTAGAATVTGFILAGEKAVETYNEFQEKISELSALTGLVGDDLNWLADQAKFLSTSTQDGGIKITKSANEILEAYKLMGSAKPELLKDKEALNEVTKQAIILAEAAKMETGPAVESLASIMNQFSAPASDAGKFINILAAGSKEGAAEVGDLSDAIIRSGAAATQANISIEQEVGLVETLAEKGVKAERAGTGLRGFILKLQKGADEFNPKVVGMSQALENLAAKNLSAKDMMELFGEESYTVASLLINNRTRFDELTTAVTGTNTAFEQAAINTDNNKAKLAQAQNKAELMRIELGEKLAPAMTMAVSSGTLFLKMLNTLVDLFSKHGWEIVFLTGAIAGYTLAVQAQTTATKANVLWTNLVTASQKAWSIATGIATRKITIATIAQQAWNLAMKMNPIGAIIAGVMALAAGLVWLAKKLGEQSLAQRAVNDVTKEAQKAIVEQKLKVQDLLAVAKDEKRSLEDRKAALQALNELSPEYFGNLSIEKSTTEELTKASDDYILSLQKQALVKAAQDKIDKLRTDYANSEIEGENKKVKWYQKTSNAIVASLGIQSYAVMNAADSANNAAKAQSDLNSQLEAMNDIIKKNSPTNTVDPNKPKVGETKLIDGKLFKWDGKEWKPVADSGGGSSDDKEAKKARDKAFDALETQQRKEINAVKKQLLEKQITEDEANAQILKKEIEFLNQKIELQKKYGLDYSETESAILDKSMKAQEELDKKTADQRKKDQIKAIKQLEANEDAALNVIKKQLADKLIDEEMADQLLLQKEIEFLNQKIALKRQNGEDTADLEGQVLDKTNKIADNALKNDAARAKDLDDIRREFADADVVREFEKNAALAELDRATKNGSLISEEEYQRLKTAIHDKYEKSRYEKTQEYLQAASNVLGIVSSINNAAKDAELKKAGDNAKKREQIEQKYAKKAQKIAIAQAAINGALAVTKILAETPKADFGIMTGILIAAAVATTAAEIAAISGQKFYAGGPTGSGGKYEPRGIVHAGEYVIPQEGMNNPELRPIIDIMEMARRNGSLARLDIRPVVASMGSGSMKQYSSGGGPSYSPSSSPSGLGGLVGDSPAISNSQLEKFNNLLERLESWEPYVAVETFEQKRDKLKEMTDGGLK